ncbi:WcaI family glycosyltransferase [Methylocystis echinoides]|uniref:WcaI family glycosyltransferase n=1 Tax=Methylocystis echinoides TaxID=29468 RepID=UPI00341E6092
MPQRDGSFYRGNKDELVMDLKSCRVRPKKILVQAINFAPEFIGCAKYTAELAQYLVSRGHIVEVITAPPHYPGWSVWAPYRGFLYAKETLHSIKVYRCPILAKGKGGGIWRLIAPLSFALASMPVVAWRIWRFRPEVVLCVEPTMFSVPTAIIAAKLVGTRCILHVQDLEVDAAFEVGHIRGEALRKFATATERSLLKKFDRIITISQGMRERLIAKGLDATRITMVRNWVDTRTIRPIPRSEPNLFRLELGINEMKFVALYAGHIGAKQGLDVIISAARELQFRDDIVFVIAGDGPLQERLKESSAELLNISFLPLQPVDRLNELLSMADLHVLPQQKWASDLVLPSKLGGMLASGRPIVAAVDTGTELFRILSDIALLVPAGDHVALAKAVCRAREEELSSMVERGLMLADMLDATQLLPMFERELFEAAEDDSDVGTGLRVDVEL